MITATFEKEEGKFVSLCVEGHAGQAEAGKDIVCSAASILVYSVAQTITQMHKQGWLTKKPHITIESGNSIVTCKPKPEYYEECLMAFFVAEMGYHLLSTHYPQYVAINMFGEA